MERQEDVCQPEMEGMKMEKTIAIQDCPSIVKATRILPSKVKALQIS